jgi:hypothetical protein
LFDGVCNRPLHPSRRALVLFPRQQRNPQKLGDDRAIDPMRVSFATTRRAPIRPLFADAWSPTLCAGDRRGALGSRPLTRLDVLHRKIS